MQKTTKTLVTILNEDLNNFKISQSKFKKESEFVDRLVILYQKLIGQLSEHKDGSLPILSMYWSCFRNLIQASIFAFEGHIPEVYTLLSKSAESLAIARKLHLNPELRSVWITKADMTPHQYKTA